MAISPEHRLEQVLHQYYESYHSQQPDEELLSTINL